MTGDQAALAGTVYNDNINNKHYAGTNLPIIAT